MSTLKFNPMESWPLNWPSDLRRLSEDAKTEAAHLIAYTLRTVAEGDLSDPATWQDLAMRRGIGTAPYADTSESPGHYMPPRFPDGPSVIAINTALPRHVQAGAWVHEFAHEELHRWIPPQLSDASDTYRYSGDVDQERHDIARRVEILILGE